MSESTKSSSATSSVDVKRSEHARILVLNPSTSDWILCEIVWDSVAGSITVTDVNDESVTSTFGVAGTLFVRLDDLYAFRLEHSQSGGALTLACFDYVDYAYWIDQLSTAGVERCGSMRLSQQSLNFKGYITKKEKSQPKKRKTYAVLRDNVLDFYETERAAQDNIKAIQNGDLEAIQITAPLRSFDIWQSVVTMTPESHKRVFAVYPDGEQIAFLLQCRDTDSFKQWFSLLTQAAGTGKEDSIPATQIFGAPLHVVMNRQGRRPPVPICMAASVEYLETNAMKIERLFFKEPTESAQKQCDKFIEAYDNGDDVRLSKCTDPLAVLLLFRAYLEALPEPLLTFEQHAAFMACFVDGKPVEERVLDQIVQLPEDNFVLLKFVCRFFYDLSLHKIKNKTSIEDYAALFGPIFCRSSDKRATLRTEMITPLTKMLIEIQRNAPTNIIYKLKDDRKKLCIAVFDYEGRTPRELSFAAGTVITVFKKDKSGWWKGGIVIDDEITLGGKPAARAARRSKELVVGWFPHDFVEDYVPGRQTEVLIVGGMNLQDAAVKSGALNADVAKRAKRELALKHAKTPLPNEEINDNSVTLTSSIDDDKEKQIDENSKKEIENEENEKIEEKPIETNEEKETNINDEKNVDLNSETNENNEKNDEIVENNRNSKENENNIQVKQSPPIEKTIPNCECLEHRKIIEIQSNAFKLLKEMFDKQLINENERLLFNKKIIALDSEILALFDALEDDLKDCSNQLKLLFSET